MSYEENEHRYDVPGHKGLLYNFPDSNSLEIYPNSPINFVDESQRLVAKNIGVENVRYLVNGSTVGLLCAIKTICDKDSIIAIPKNVHKSILNGIELVGCNKMVIKPKPYQGIDDYVNFNQYKAAIDNGADVIVIIYPTYFGVCDSDTVSKTIEYCKENGVSVIIDQAHGAHLKYFADADVTITSTHKMLTSITGTAAAFVKDEHVEEFDKWLGVFQTTSPNYFAMSTIEQAFNHKLFVDTKDVEEETLHIRKRMEDFITIKLIDTQDILKLTIDISNTSYNGEQFLKMLYEKHNISGEVYTENVVVFMLSYWHFDVEYLFLRLLDFDNEEFIKTTLQQKHSEFVLRLPIIECEGYLLREDLIMYPPGTAIAHKGEVLTKCKIDFIISETLANKMCCKFDLNNIPVSKIVLGKQK